MKRYDHIKSLGDEDVRRLTGIKRASFKRMIVLLLEAEKVQKKKRGRSNKLSIEERLLLTLEYLREYRTYFHIANSYGIHETTAIRISRWVEDVLVKSQEFSLPGRKALLKSDMEYEVILVDATESACERPKKRSKIKSE